MMEIIRDGLNSNPLVSQEFLAQSLAPIQLKASAIMNLDVGLQKVLNEQHSLCDALELARCLWQGIGMKSTDDERHRFAGGFRYGFFQKWSDEEWQHAAWSNILADHAVIVLDLLVFSSANRDLTTSEVKIACSLVEHGDLLFNESVVARLLTVLDAQQT